MKQSAAGDKPPDKTLAGMMPSQQFLRYLLVGGWNTVFGYGCFFLINHLLSRIMQQYSYLAANVISNLIAVSMAFLAYKWFVFRTEGHYLREWLRTLMVYSGGILLSTIALAPLVGLIRNFTRFQSQAPYIAAAIVIIVTAGSSFLGHRHFSFRSSAALEMEPKDSVPEN
jgi:putative flippase GtrA